MKSIVVILTLVLLHVSHVTLAASKALNGNDLAAEITRREGKKVSISIAQTKEVLRVLREVLDEMSLEDYAETLTNILRLEKPKEESK